MQDKLLIENAELKSRVAELERLLDTDALTGVGSQRKYLEVLEERQNASGVMVVAFDIIDFGHFNKIYGHHEGDRVLRMFGDKLKQVFRSSDRIYQNVFRRGGDEFAAILDISEFANQEDIESRLDKYGISKLAYIGFATSFSHISMETLVNQAFWQIEEQKRKKSR